MNVDFSKNAKDIGVNLLFVLLWVGAFGIVDVGIEWMTLNEKYKFLTYLTIFLLAFILFLFIDSGCQGG